MTFIRLKINQLQYLIAVSSAPVDSAEFGGVMNNNEKAFPKTNASLSHETQVLVQNIFQLVRHGETRWLSRLLQIGLAPDLSDSDGNSLLMLAVDNGQREAAQLLLEKGADANASTPDGLTPLMFAARRHRKDLVELLLNHGADPVQPSDVA